MYSRIDNVGFTGVVVPVLRAPLAPLAVCFLPADIPRRRASLLAIPPGSDARPQRHRRHLAPRASLGSTSGSGQSNLQPSSRPTVDYVFNQSDFGVFREQSVYFKDNTGFIRQLDSMSTRPHIVFLGPSRFGKSLLCSMLRSYYDYKRQGSFEQLFGGLDIGEQPTTHASQYHVLSIRLSVEPEVGVPLSNAFSLLNRRMNDACEVFRRYYGLSFQIEQSGAQSIRNACAAVGTTSRNKVLIIIDEFDRLPNAAMSLGANLLDEYMASMARDAKTAQDITKEGRTAGDNSTAFSSPIRALYSTLKDMSDGVADFGLKQLRTFTTGVSPVALADVSLFNIGFNLTTLPEVAGAVGFTTEDVKVAIERATMVPEECRDPLLQLMRAWFKDYRFYTGADSVTLFHPMLVMNLLSDVQNFESTRTELSDILGMQLRDCRRLPAAHSGRRLPLPEGPPSPVRYPPSGFMDMSNVTETSNLLSLLARRKASKSTFTFNELFLVGSKIPSHLLQTAYKQSELLSPDVTEHGHPLDRIRLLLLYHGLLTCCDITREVQSDRSVIKYYIVRPTNLATSFSALPLRTELFTLQPSAMKLLDAPTEPSVSKFFQTLANSTVRRLNEYGFQHGILKWFKGWKSSTGRTDVEVSAEVQLKGPSGVRFMDFTLHDFASDRALNTELKRVPLNKIDVDKWVEGSRRTKSSREIFASRRLLCCPR